VWAVLLRIVIFLLPIACALFVTWSAQQVLPVPQDSGDRVLWWATLLGLGLAVALSAERLARGLLPLATLLQLAMLFPDRAPSRFRVARQAGSVRQLEATAASGAEGATTAEEILALVARLSAHDRRTRGHAERVRVYTDLIASEMALPEEDRYRLRWAALLHDIGKLSVDADILNKTDPLTEDEWTEIRRHPHEGVRRIVAVADAYDTMTSVRSYKLPVATRAAREELVACSGRQFDPWVVRSFLAVSLPRLLWATGPVSLLVHVPFLARLQVAGQVGVTTAAQAVTATAAAAVIATGLVGPLDRPARVSADPPFERTVSRTEAERARNLDPQRGAEAHDERNEDEKDQGKGDGGNRNDDPSPAPDGVTQPPPDDGSDATPSPVAPSPTPPPQDETSPTPPPPDTTGTVPDVVGMSAVDATKALEQAGFVVKIVKTWGTDKTLRNIVYAQSEPAGSELELGSTVRISVWKWRNSG
jgi:hypothetical protein